MALGIARVCVECAREPRPRLIAPAPIPSRPWTGSPSIRRSWDRSQEPRETCVRSGIELSLIEIHDAEIVPRARVTRVVCAIAR
jgi:hypothetical protein